MAKKNAKPTPQPQEAPRGPQEHVIANGDTTREPTEIETLARLPVPSEVAITPSTPEKTLRELLQAIQALKINRRGWDAMSPYQRYFIEGVRIVALEALGEKDESGRPASVSRTLGFNILTGKTLGHGA